MWAIEINWINRTGENSDFGLTRIDSASQTQILGVQDCGFDGCPQLFAVGNVNDLLEMAKRLNQRWLKGIGTAMVLAKIK